MPQISPMKWLLLSLITQSSLLQIISFLNMKKMNNIERPQTTQFKVFMNKLPWKW